MDSERNIDRGPFALDPEPRPFAVSPEPAPFKPEPAQPERRRIVLLGDSCAWVEVER